MALGEIAFASILGVEPVYFIGGEPHIEKPVGAVGAFQQLAKERRLADGEVCQEWGNHRPPFTRSPG
jgi:hypothetical protein